MSHVVPVERKRKRGNPGKRPLPEVVSALPATEKPPAAPKGLGPEGRAFWKRAWSVGREWVAGETDWTLVAMTAQLLDERAELRTLLADPKVGRTFTLATGRVSSRPEVAQVREVEAQLLKHLAALGFTPADRTRLGVAEVKRMSALDELVARRAAGQ